MSKTDNTFVYEINSGQGQKKYYLSALPHQYGLEFGLPTEVIMGELVDGPENFIHQKFTQNEAFLKFLAWVIGKHATSCPGLVAELKNQPNGFIYILDKKTPDLMGKVPPEDIVGGVETKDGAMARFHSSPKYRVFTENGLMQLDPWFQKKLVEELVAHSKRKASAT